MILRVVWRATALPTTDPWAASASPSAPCACSVCGSATRSGTHLERRRLTLFSRVSVHGRRQDGQIRGPARDGAQETVQYAVGGQSAVLEGTVTLRLRHPARPSRPHRRDCGVEGRQADVPHAAEVHRKAIRDAVHRATDLASAARVNASAEELARMFEALSLMSSTPAEPHGRLTTVVEPAAGFAALAGVTPAKRVAEAPKDRATTTGKKVTLSVVPHAVERRVRKASQERRASEAAVEAAIRTLDRARVREQAARRSLEHAETDVQVAEHAVVKARQILSGDSA